MPRVRQFSDEEWEEIEAGESQRRAIDVIRWSYFDREGVEPELRATGRAMADRYLRERGILSPES